METIRFIKFTTYCRKLVFPQERMQCSIWYWRSYLQCFNIHTHWIIRNGVQVPVWAVCVLPCTHTTTQALCRVLLPIFAGCSPGQTGIHGAVFQMALPGSYVWFNGRDYAEPLWKEYGWPQKRGQHCYFLSPMQGVHFLFDICFKGVQPVTCVLNLLTYSLHVCFSLLPCLTLCTVNTFYVTFSPRTVILASHGRLLEFWNKIQILIL